MYHIFYTVLFAACWWYLSPKRRAARSMLKRRFTWFINVDPEVEECTARYTANGCRVALTGRGAGEGSRPPERTDEVDRAVLYMPCSHKDIEEALSTYLKPFGPDFTKALVVTRAPCLAQGVDEAAASYGITWYCMQKGVKVVHVPQGGSLHEAIDGGGLLCVLVWVQLCVRWLYSDAKGSETPLSPVSMQPPTPREQEVAIPPSQPATPPPQVAQTPAGLLEPARPMLLPRRSSGCRGVQRPTRSPNRSASPAFMTAPPGTPSVSDVVFIDPVLPEADPVEVTVLVPTGQPVPLAPCNPNRLHVAGGKKMKKVYVSGRAGVLMRDLCGALTNGNGWCDVSCLSDARNEVSAAKTRAGQLPTIDILLEEKGTAELIVYNWNKSDKLIRHTNKSGCFAAAGKRATQQNQRDKTPRTVLVNCLTYARCLTSKSHFHFKFLEEMGLQDIVPTPITVLSSDVPASDTGLWRVLGGNGVFNRQDLADVSLERERLVQQYVEGVDICIPVIITPQYEFLVQRSQDLPPSLIRRCNDIINVVLLSAKPHLPMSRWTPAQAMCTFGVLSFDFTIPLGSDSLPLLLSVSPYTNASPSILGELLSQIVLPLYHGAAPCSSSKRFEKLCNGAERRV